MNKSPVNLLDAALAYAAQGVPVFPCNASKKPNTPHGFKDATTDPVIIKRWWFRWPQALIGVPTGEVSGIAVLDLDTKNGKNGFDFVPDWELRSTIISRTQSGGAHLYFSAKGAPHCTSDEIADGVDTRGTGGYVIVPPSPGYVWVNGHDLATLGKWPDDLRPPQRVQGTPGEPEANPNLIAAALAVIPNDNIGWDDWNRIGMAAWRATGGNGFEAFDQWSAKSKKYNARETHRRWQHYFKSPPKEVGAGSLIHYATQSDPSWRNRYDALAAAHGAFVASTMVTPHNDPRYRYDPTASAHGAAVASNILPSLKISKGPLADVPAHLLNVPGILSHAVAYYRNTAPKDQPQFAVQTALALGSVVMGRRWMTNRYNFSSLYFINVSKSATGKEHAKTVIEKILEEAQLQRLIGPSGYTSSSGVFSSLIKQPTHIAIIDELGRVLQSSKVTGNSHKADAQTIIMETFGRQSSTLRPPGFSNMGMTQKQAAEFDKVVIRPSLTLLSMTTPGTLYDNLSSHYITDGFLGRFIIVESFIGREVGNELDPIAINSDLISWVKTCAHGGGNLTAIDTYDVAPEPIVVPFQDVCKPLLQGFDKQILSEMNNLDAVKMESMLGRTKEIAQRLALIVAVSKNESEVSVESLQWAIDYAGFYARRAIVSLRKSVADGPFEAACKAVIAAIEKSAMRGMTESELSRGVRMFANLEPRRRREVLETLIVDRGIFLREQASGGRPRKAWVGIIKEEEE